MSDDLSLPFPFRVVVNPSPEIESTDLGFETPSHPEGEDGWDLDDIEAAYQQALESLDTLEATVADVVGEPQFGAHDEALALDPVVVAPASSRSRSRAICSRSSPAPRWRFPPRQ